eukprot:gnl/Hemi2/15570_TR5236_c0_g1_i1.p1 gnl/Hemi2/15570_TR5236_c0_g1~~gnl/Hemi2/15570_TR5236_c0_g1_i1.p1  ORF type:complete len:111 (-),score=22.76 gnl/Hemi2/15570_TR5236_c0_g1_i1:132-464(-)
MQTATRAARPASPPATSPLTPPGGLPPALAPTGRSGFDSGASEPSQPVPAAAAARPRTDHTKFPSKGGRGAMKCDSCFDYNRGVKEGACSLCGGRNEVFEYISTDAFRGW